MAVTLGNARVQPSLELAYIKEQGKVSAANSWPYIEG